MEISLSNSTDAQIKPLPIIGAYNRQRFRQWSPEDNANWYITNADDTKEQFAMYPAMGRAHFNNNGVNLFVYGSEPRGIFKTINYFYVVDGNAIYRYDKNWNQITLGGDSLQTIAGDIYFAFLVVFSTVYACFVDGEFIYIYQEGSANGLQRITDPNAPGITVVNGVITKPGYIAAFGNRITVSVANSSQFILSAINLIGNGTTVFDPTKCFTNADGQVFALESGIIRQMGVLNNTLYIFTDYTTGVWSNTTAFFSGTGVTFPWKKNSTYDWNFGIANPNSLDIDFGLMVFLAQNSDGLLQFMVSSSDQPTKIQPSKAIDTLLQRYTNQFGNQNPFVDTNSNGFLYQYENTIFYRMSGGNYSGDQILDDTINGNSIEYNFESKEWHRLIELNGERNRIQFHQYFNNLHLVTVVGENTIYQMSGQFYFNEIRNLNQPNSQASDAYLAYPFRYERITPIIYQKDYSEFLTEFVQIDFVWGDSDLHFSTSPFLNTQFLIAETSLNGQPQFLIAEDAGSDGQPIYLISEGSNTPSLSDLTYNYLYNPQVELWYSDDGGISFDSADVREFSQSGVYSWRMRWYQLGASRNRVYKLICVSPVPIVILGGTMNVKRISGGAY